MIRLIPFKSYIIMNFIFLKSFNFLLNSCAYKASIWDHHIGGFDNLFDAGLQTNVIIIMASVRLCKFKGNLRVTLT